MNCGFSHERLWAWVHNWEDDPAECDVVARHVDSCPSCKSSVDEMRGLLGDLRKVVVTTGQSAAPKLPEQIGNYKILRRIGQGGMGVVYEARQHQPSRPVALKVILGGRHVDELQIRFFQREVQSLARLNHPGIATIHEAGRTEDGLHFFAMEMVAGLPLIDFASGERSAGKAPPLSPADRLRLFRKIADAISYAHQRGVIHRDLKPSNILVSDDAVPKVLDFGLARMAADDAATPSIHTEKGRLLGTLPYMSPEQAEGRADAIDVRTDAYALGVVLYELMTGQLPYEVGDSSLVQAVRIICEKNPIDPRGINRALHRDVAAIILKALEKDPARRYQSVAAMSDDIERFLTGHPILARPPSTLYQLRMMIARHKAPALLAAALLVSIVLFGIVAAIQADRIAKERDNVALEARKLARINAVLERIYQAPDYAKAGSTDISVVAALNEAEEFLETEFPDDPLVAAAVRNTLGNTYRSLNHFDQAQRHLTFAVETRNRLLGPNHLETAESLNDLGELRYLDDKPGHLDAAESLWRSALAIRTDQLPAADPAIAETRNNLGVLLRKRGNYEEAAQMFISALVVRQNIYDRAAAGDPSFTTQQKKQACNDLAQCLNNLGGLMRDLNKTSDAFQYYDQALKLRQSCLGPDHPEVAKMLNNLAKLSEEGGNLAAAEQSYRRALAILTGPKGIGPAHVFIANVQYSLADVLDRLGRRPEAESLARQALAMRETLGVPPAKIDESRDLLHRITHPPLPHVP